MAFENGVNWRPLAPEKRGKHDTFASAVDAVFQEMMVEKNPFFDTLSAQWSELVGKLPMRPGRYESGEGKNAAAKIYLYVQSAPALFAMRPKLAALKKKLLALSGAPKKLELKLEIKSF